LNQRNCHDHRTSGYRHQHGSYSTRSRSRTCRRTRYKPIGVARRPGALDQWLEDAVMTLSTDRGGRRRAQWDVDTAGATVDDDVHERKGNAHGGPMGLMARPLATSARPATRLPAPDADETMATAKTMNDRLALRPRTRVRAATHSRSLVTAGTCPRCLGRHVVGHVVHNPRSRLCRFGGRTWEVSR
jgi:hypothetical protein